MYKYSYLILFAIISFKCAYYDETILLSVESYQNICGNDLSNIGHLLDSNLILTFTFNEETIFPEEYEDYASTILDKCKNPGLGIRSIHQQGITGKDVNIAMFDMCDKFENQEYSKNIKKFLNTGYDPEWNNTHGAAMLSIAVGNNIGTAPDANVFFAAVSFYKYDAKYCSDALKWIIEENRQLPVNEKIRIVSISAGPLMWNINTVEWDSMRVAAENENILILECTYNYGPTSVGYYDFEKVDDIENFTLGFPHPDWILENDSTKLYVPACRRTCAEEYNPYSSYIYEGNGGQSEGIAYLAGVIALGLQVMPSLSNEDIINLLFNSAYHKDGCKIINPVAFIDRVNKVTKTTNLKAAP